MNSTTNFYLSSKMKQMFFLFVSTALMCSMIAKSAFADEPPHVVASIKPVHSLVSFVMQGVGKPDLLLKVETSPHMFNLRPSIAAAIQDANIVFWVGEAMETSLADPIDALVTDARVVALSTADHLIVKTNRHEFVFQPHDEHYHETHEMEEVEQHEDKAHKAEVSEHGHEHGHGHEHSHGSLDMHLWLDPANAVHMVRMIAAKLSELNPSNTENYASNADEFERRADQLLDELSERLAPAKGIPFIVYHDACRYFEERFGLTAAGSVLGSSHQPMSIHRVLKLREIVREYDIKCVFSDPQIQSEKFNVVVEGSSARIATIDPLGANIEDGPELYFVLIDKLADSFFDCLVVDE